MVHACALLALADARCGHTRPRRYALSRLLSHERPRRKYRFARWPRTGLKRDTWTRTTYG
ncbi:unnamed protein product [Trichogramma brassicae]|uniref:Uncharacterized protein n=1 Tax=Trichogramma brassicae TaxID=86971 RepID=A0A6H5I4C6_9HYME|nr:unnamed protein product [Trichogramma brassicae]